jgi:hypothetical protein
MKPRIVYIELKSHTGGHDDRGPAWIGRVTFSKTGRTMYYKGKELRRLVPAGCANHYDVETDEAYWISGCKKNGEDRYPWAQNAPVEIDEDVREEYWTKIRSMPEKKNERFA